MLRFSVYISQYILIEAVDVDTSLFIGWDIGTIYSQELKFHVCI